MKSLAVTVFTVALLAGCGSVAHSNKVAADMPTRASNGMLIGPNGKTLYTFAKDVKNSGSSACYEQCASNWPPLAAAPAAQPTGDYSIIVRTDGTRQWAFQGQPLYYFAKDTQAGQQNGNGLGGNWSIVQP